MGTNGSPWGWWAIFATLNLALIYVLCAPIYTLRGCIWAGMSPSGAGVAAEEADTMAWPVGSETSGPVGSWGDGWETVELGTRQDRFRGGWEERRWEHDVTPLKSPQKPSASDPTTASVYFPHPSISIHWASSSSFHASSLFLLACSNNFNP